MKRILINISLFFFFISCSTNNCIESYLKEKKSNNIGKVASVLTDQKIDVANTLNVYQGRTRGQRDSRAKSFNQEDYDFLRKQYKNDTIIEYWSKKESKDFEFMSLVKRGGLSRLRDSISSTNENLDVYNYNLSKPIFTKNKKLALFSILVTKQPHTTIENSVIIMKKSNGKWIEVENVNSTALH